MSDKKRTTTIELTADDDYKLDIIKYATGTDSTIAAIRYAIRVAADSMGFSAAQLQLKKEKTRKSVS